MSSSPIRTVMITGANGYLASHIVQILLDKGYTVHACVRNSANESSVSHLLSLGSSCPGKLQLFSTGDMGDKSLYGRFLAPLVDCDAVIHAATPLSYKFSEREFDGVRDILRPGMEGTQELLDSILSCPTRSRIQALVLTSSMSAAAPTPEPPVKDEFNAWSDDVAQLARHNYYGCLKTRQERLCQQWSDAQRNGANTLAPHFKFAAICPTMILGPPVVVSSSSSCSCSCSSSVPAATATATADPYTPSGTMGSLYRWITGGRPSAPNDSMSFIHVRDCAAMHVAAMENKDASGRYFSLVESWHWNDILQTLKQLHPNMPLNTPYKYEGNDIIRPTQFNLERMNSLGVEVRGIREILKESIEFFKSKNLL